MQGARFEKRKRVRFYSLLARGSGTLKRRLMVSTFRFQRSATSEGHNGTRPDEVIPPGPQNGSMNRVLSLALPTKGFSWRDHLCARVSCGCATLLKPALIPLLVSVARDDPPPAE